MFSLNPHIMFKTHTCIELNKSFLSREAETYSWHLYSNQQPYSMTRKSLSLDNPNRNFGGILITIYLTNNMLRETLLRSKGLLMLPTKVQVI